MVMRSSSVLGAMPAVDLNSGSTVKVVDRSRRRGGRHEERAVHDAADQTPTTSATPSATHPVVANHHHDHPGFGGPSGALMGLLFAVKGGGRARFICDLADIGPHDRVVDIGCGPGNAVRAAAARGGRATGVDPSPVMLSVARALTVRRRSAITWAGGAAETIPVADGSATVVWSVACVHHWADVAAGVAEVRRVL